MCGICGLVKKNFHYSDDKAIVQKMMDSIIHRGPDDEGIYQNGDVALGFRRLSIIDLQSGHQPLSNEDGTIWIVFNGEIYNFPALRDSLIAKGHLFRTNSDTETIVHLYEEYGTNCVEYLEGMFAFVIHDQNKRVVFGARDRFGKKPLFYSLSGASFLFGSELKTLKVTGQIDTAIDELAIDDYFAYGYTAGDRTFYKNVRRLLPATRFILDLNSFTFKTEKYWHLSYRPAMSLNESEWIEKIDVLFTQAVQKRLISDVPLGAFLSGGLDSSAVVWKMTELLTNSVKTFSIGFSEKKYDETSFARIIAEKFGTDHREEFMGPASIPDLDTIINTFDEPFADSSSIPTLFLSAFTRKYVTVALSGDGGDEIFAGYNTYSKLNSLFGKTQKVELTKMYSLLNKIYPPFIRGKATVNYLSQSKRDVIYRQNLWTLSEREKLLKISIPKDNRAEKFREERFRDSLSGSFISDLQLHDIQNYMTDDILCKVDRSSMAHSLEVRSPLLDHKFVEMVFTIPVELKLKGGEGKYIFRKYLSNYLPDEIVHPRKKGFGIPLSVWFRERLLEYVNDQLLSKENNPLFNYIEKKYLVEYLSKMPNSKRDLGSQVWSLLLFNKWLNSNA